jgi:hypothetical protein
VATFDNLPGYQFNVTPQTTWGTSDPTIVGVASSVAGPTNTTTANQIGTATVTAAYGGASTTQAVRVWDPARLAQVTSTAVRTVEFPGCAGQQVTMTANFSDNTTEDVTPWTQWSPLGDSGYGLLSLGGYFTPTGNRNGYLQIMGSMGRGIYLPVAGYIGVFGTCP